MRLFSDADTVSPVLLQLFERVRHSADFMPIKQVHRQLRSDFGDGWRSQFLEFEDKPFAAASIGQVVTSVFLGNELFWLIIDVWFAHVSEDKQVCKVLEYKKILGSSGCFTRWSKGCCKSSVSRSGSWDWFGYWQSGQRSQSGQYFPQRDVPGWVRQGCVPFLSRQIFFCEILAFITDFV